MIINHIKWKKYEQGILFLKLLSNIYAMAKYCSTPNIKNVIMEMLARLITLAVLLASVKLSSELDSFNDTTLK